MRRRANARPVRPWQPQGASLASRWLGRRKFGLIPNVRYRPRADLRRSVRPVSRPLDVFRNGALRIGRTWSATPDSPGQTKTVRNATHCAAPSPAAVDPFAAIRWRVHGQPEGCDAPRHVPALLPRRMRQTRRSSASAAGSGAALRRFG